MRQRNTTRTGGAFSHEIKSAVWNKARIVAGLNSSITRMDRYGAYIDWAAYGQRTTNGNGWEIDHIKPVAAGGDDFILNLQPLQWQNNVEKSDTYPYTGSGKVTAK